MDGTNNYHIARYTLTGRRLGENIFKNQEEAQKFIYDYIYITFSKPPEEELLEKVFDNVNKTDGIYKFWCGDVYFFITKIKSNP